MNGKLMLYIDERYGTKFYAKSVRDLRSQIGGGGSRVSKMYVDIKSGQRKHVGYVIGNYWLRAFVPYEKIDAR